MGLYDELMLRFPGFRDRPGASDAFDQDTADVPASAVRAAAFELLNEDPRHLPNGIEVRRRVFENVGLLAPSFAEAEHLLGEVVAGRLAMAKLPGPVREFDRANVAPFRREAAYGGIARLHDRRVLAPGGLAELRAAGEFWRAVDEARLDRPALSASVDVEPDLPLSSSKVREVREAMLGATKNGSGL